MSHQVRATVKAWGVNDTDATPRLERWLRVFNHTIIESGQSIVSAPFLFDETKTAVREKVLEGVQSDSVLAEWGKLALLKPAEVYQQLESTRNRLQRFERRQIQRLMGLPINNVEIKDVIENGKILLVNLQPSPNFDSEDSRTVGTLLMNEIWEVAGQRQKKPDGTPPGPPCLVIVDEFQKFLTHDVPEMLDQAAKYGIHLCLFHQHLLQIKERDPEAFGSINNARVKLVFGGLSREDADFMAGEIFAGQFDIKKIKLQIEQTKFWPKYTREKVYTSSKGGGSASSAGVASGVTESTGSFFDETLQTWIPGASLAGTSEGMSESNSQSSGTSESESWSEGVNDIPFYRMEAFREVSSVQTYSLDELRWEMAEKLMLQYQRHFFLRRPGKPTVACVTPFVKSRYVSPEMLHRYVEGLLKNYLHSKEVDQHLDEIKRDLVENVEPAITVTKAGRKKIKTRKF